MSGNRGPNRSSFGPTSGLLPIRLMWSSISISVPGLKSRLMPPAALVSIRVFTPTRRHRPHGKRDRAEVVPFVEMRPPRQRRHPPPPARPDHQAPGVPDHRRRRPVRDLAVGERHRIGQVVGKVTQPGSEHHRHIRHGSPGAEPGRGLVDEVERGHMRLVGSRCRVQGSGFEVQGSRFKVRGSRFSVQHRVRVQHQPPHPPASRT